MKALRNILLALTVYSCSAPDDQESKISKHAVELDSLLDTTLVREYERLGVDHETAVQEIREAKVSIQAQLDSLKAAQAPEH